MSWQLRMIKNHFKKDSPNCHESIFSIFFATIPSFGNAEILETLFIGRGFPNGVDHKGQKLIRNLSFFYDSFQKLNCHPHDDDDVDV